MSSVHFRYEIDVTRPFSSKGKCPWITVNGQDVEDSQLVVEYFAAKMDKDLDKHLTDEQRAASRSIRIMIEEHLYWCMVLERWEYDDCRDITKIFPPSIFPDSLPKDQHQEMLKSMRPNMIKQAHGQGLGRHTKETVLKFGR